MVVELEQRRVIAIDCHHPIGGHETQAPGNQSPRLKQRSGRVVPLHPMSGVVHGLPRPSLAIPDTMRCLRRLRPRRPHLAPRGGDLERGHYVLSVRLRGGVIRRVHLDEQHAGLVEAEAVIRPVVVDPELVQRVSGVDVIADLRAAARLERSRLGREVWTPVEFRRVGAGVGKSGIYVGGRVAMSRLPDGDRRGSFGHPRRRPAGKSGRAQRRRERDGLQLRRHVDRH